MSRSYRHKQIIGNTFAESEKKDKLICNKKLRKLARMLLMKHFEDFIEPLKNEVSDRWVMSKEGKKYFNKSKFPQFMRK
ncbi:MAG: hypothetical protein US76_04055 [Parcubacteria group bacterium GW2011_GWA2_38_13b]|nr:MAG: hypothetical protein US76_04055 [Parcubacteria group bacterium GW2011_GWA2_38_13b]